MATHIGGRDRTQVAAPRAGTTEAEVRPYPGYKALWMMLLLGWVASGADRTITGPVVTYMIQAKTPIMAGADNPFALGGLVGSLLFAGYMLTQFPGGYVGDRLGHRTVIVIAVMWAGAATILSGLITALLGFVALRVITGLGAGLFYSNDRAVIAEQYADRQARARDGLRHHRPSDRHHARAPARRAADRPRRVGVRQGRRLADAVHRARLDGRAVRSGDGALLPQPDRRARVPAGLHPGGRAAGRLRGRVLRRDHGHLHDRHERRPERVAGRAAGDRRRGRPRRRRVRARWAARWAQSSRTAT